MAPKLVQGRKHKEPHILTDAPCYEEFSLDAYGHLSWVVGFNNDDDEEEVPAMVIIAEAANGRSDEEIERMQQGVRDCGDWLACLDYDVKGDWVGYHVVVNSDHAGWIDTLESGVMSIEDARKHLPGLIDTWHDVASEHLVESGDWFTKEEIESNEANIVLWKRSLKEALG
jgi:hypothetical protein